MRAQAVEKNFQPYSNVGCDVLLPFVHPVFYRCVLLGVVAQSLKPLCPFAYSFLKRLKKKLNIIALTIYKTS